jgi:tetratricopeptide (TPR) repeat protein
VTQLLAGLDMPQLRALDMPLARYTGGNPLFIVETLKSLAELNRLDGSFPQAMPPPGRVEALITARLARLSASALRLARAAAVAGSDFGLELTGQLLRSDPLELADPWQELERAQILNGTHFTHDLVLDAVLRSTPEPVRALLHLRTARHLQATNAPAAVVARHYLAAGESGEAVPSLTRAAQEAKDSYRLTEAADFYRQAGAALAALGQQDQAFDAYLQALEMMRHFDMGEQLEPLLEQLFKLANDDRQYAQAWHHRSEHAARKGDGQQAEQAARRGYDHSCKTNDLKLQGNLLNDLATSLWLQDRLQEAHDIFKEMLLIAERTDMPSELASSLTNFGVILDHLERHREALEHHQRAAALTVDAGDKTNLVYVLNNLSISQLELGLVHASIDTLRQAIDIAADTEGLQYSRSFSLLLLGACWLDVPDYLQAQAYFDETLRDAFQTAPYAVSACLRHQARMWSDLGAFEQAEASLAQAFMQKAEACLASGKRKRLEGNLRLVKARLLPPKDALTSALEARHIAVTHDLNGLLIGAETRCAQALLALHRPEEALEHTSRAVDLLELYHPVDFYLGEVHLTHYQALAATRRPEATKRLIASLAWLTDVAMHRTPAAYRQGFLAHNPVNRTLIAAARSAGLAVPR